MGDHHPPGHASPVQRLLDLLWAERSDLWVVLVYAVGVGLLSLAVPVATAALVNTITFAVVLQPLVVLTVMVFGALAFDGVMRAMQVQVVEMIQRRVFVRATADLAQRLPRMRAETADIAHVPELVNRFFDVVTVQKAFATLLLDGLSVLLQALVGTLLLAFYHPLLLAFDVVLVLGIAFIIWPLGHRAIETSIGESRAKYAVAAWLEELARPGETFQGMGAARYARQRADALSGRYLAARADHFRIVLRQHVGTLAFRAIFSAALLGLGGLLVIQRGLTIGQLAAAELVVTSVVFGMTKLSKQLETAYDLAAAVDKLGHLADLPLERAGGAPVPVGSPRGARLSLRGVSFGYGGAPVLCDAHLALDAGARAAVLGASGSGKSTLADLLVGRRAPAAGAVTLEGADLRELSLDALRAAVAVVRDVALFEGTVAENIAVGRPEVDAARVREALTAVGLGDTVSALPAGVDTALMPGGAPLSMTQARRLMFARAIAGAPRLLVVDGALDALDDDAASELLAVLSAPDAPWTLLVLTHHASVAAACDTRLRLRDGALAGKENGADADRR